MALDQGLANYGLWAKSTCFIVVSFFRVYKLIICIFKWLKKVKRIFYDMKIT